MMKKTLGFAVLVFIGLACGGLGQKSEEVTTIREVKQEYLKSKDDARKKYEGKDLTVLGTVTYRSSVNPSLRVGSTTDSDIPITVPDIECTFNENDVLFKDVNEKQVIKVKGVLKFTESGIEMNPCKFIPL